MQLALQTWTHEIKNFLQFQKTKNETKQMDTFIRETRV
jgi:hypothetical protein